MSDRDLFGAPINPRKGMNGRPRHFPTDETRRDVRALRVRGFSQNAIALAMGITIPTLVRHYAAELASTAAIGRQYR